MRIAIDAMGGDHAPDAIVNGAIDALSSVDLGPDDTLVLIGDEEIIREIMEERGVEGDPRLEIEPTTEVIAMDESQVTVAVKKKPNSSIVRMGRLGSKKAGDRRCDVVISAGNTGACVAACQMSMRRLRGVHRPGIAVPMPTFFGPVVLCDVGANPEPRPLHLHQYGHMAKVYAERIIGIENPRVALMSIGEEESKGNALVRETNALLRADQTINYVGYVEGRDLFANGADVVITEGFTGNVILKLSEGLASGIFKTIAHEIFETDPDLAMKFEPVVKRIYKKHDYHEYGGAPLLGANGVCLICHGSSEARTIVAAVRTAFTIKKKRVNEGIISELAKFDERSLKREAEAGEGDEGPAAATDAKPTGDKPASESTEATPAGAGEGSA